MLSHFRCAYFMKPDSRNAASTIQTSVPSSITAHGYGGCIGKFYWLISKDKCTHRLYSYSTMAMFSQKAQCYSRIPVSLTLVVDSDDSIN